VYGDTHYPFATVVNSDTQVSFDTPRFADAITRLECIAPEKSVLDVGCGAGLFLALARDRGWKVLGTEPLAAYRRHATDRLGQDTVLSATASQLELGPRKFGVITFWEVLDHVTHPSAVLEACRRWLAPGGIVLIYVRNSNSLAARVLRERCNVFLGYAHLNFWSPSSVMQFARRHNMSVVEMKSLISELGPVSNFLSYEDPYRGTAPPVLPGVTARDVEEAMLGYKIMALLKAD
jgi:2-polyprenyl-3-methyl-5-hydroxy-6-metoxy-1,4-benzoquinol methylase